MPALVALAPPKSRVPRGPVRVHVRHVPALPSTVCITSGVPPKLLAVWDVADLRRYGMVDGRLCFEVGTRGGRLEGAWALLADRADKLVEALAASASTSRSSISNDNRKQLQLKIDKRLSDMNDSADMDMTPSWNLDQMSEAESSIGFGDSASVIDGQISKHGSSESRESLRPVNLGRCMSCMSHLGAPVAGSAASSASGAWTAMDSFNEMRPETDRASLYSRSSGGTSEYSVPKTFWKDCSMSSKSASPICPLPPGPIVQMRNSCTCQCLRSQKSFSGPYENYDVPKPPMPLIQEYPASSPSMRKSDSNYDVPKNLKKCLTKDIISCTCSHNNIVKSISIPFTPTAEIASEDADSLNNQLDLHIEAQASSSHSNYTNIEPITDSTMNKTTQEQPSVDMSLILDEFESSAQILRNAGFCQDEIDGLEDIPENEPLCMNHEHHYSCTDSQNTKTSLSNYNTPEKSFGVKGFESSFAENSTLTRRKSSSADFLKKAEAFFDMAKSNSHKDVSTDLNPLTKNNYSNMMLENFINLNHQTVIRKSDLVKPEKPVKPDTTFLSKFRDSVKIRRSSSAPSKSEKNRDSSSSSDSGVSTGSLKYPKYDGAELDLPIMKHACQNKTNRKTIDYSPISITSTTSDPMQQISFKFHEVPNMIKSESFDAGPMNCIRRHNKGLPSLDSHGGVRSPSSCGSETSDYLETLSMSSISSNETSSRCITRPRSGREYSTIQNTLRRQNACERCCHLPQEI
ncbi:uncharacterized protein LOC143914534 isoform X2 [Arctopsyche grandis]